jgi:hypothetical protein
MTLYFLARSGKVKIALDRHTETPHYKELAQSVINGCSEVPLCDANDTVAHVLRDETVIVPNDADNRNVDVREYARWSTNRSPASLGSG